VSSHPDLPDTLPQIQALAEDERKLALEKARDAQNGGGSNQTSRKRKPSPNSSYTGSSSGGCDEIEWTCRVCTYSNRRQALACSMCRTERGRIKPDSSRIKKQRAPEKRTVVAPDSKLDLSLALALRLQDEENRKRGAAGCGGVEGRRSRGDEASAALARKLQLEEQARRRPHAVEPVNNEHNASEVGSKMEIRRKELAGLQQPEDSTLTTKGVLPLIASVYANLRGKVSPMPPPIPLPSIQS
jgi:hypothetical protein